MKSIFPRTCAAIEKTFQDAGTPEKVLLVPLDYAKSIHTALACNGAGAQLRAPFQVRNNPAGVTFLEDVIQGLCRKHHIQGGHVVIGGEDGASFCSNFIHALACRGYLVIGLNAQDAKIERGKLPASTDKLDLLGVAALLMKREGRAIGPDPSVPAALRTLTRHRDSLVRAHTASALRVHHLAGQLIPGFLDPSQSGLSPFTEASLWLMSERFSPAQIKARQQPALIAKLRDFQVDHPEQTARQIRTLAGSVLPAPAALCESLQFGLAREIEVYQALEQSLQRSARDIALRLAPTSGAMLTTLPGIAIPSAAGLYAELADPARRRPLYRMTSYAGLVARLKQSGGPEKEARPFGRSHRANQTLKNLLFLLVRQVGQHGHQELKADHARRVDQGQDARFTMARRMLRIVVHLLEHGDFFLPPSLRADPDPQALRAYYLRVWPGLLVKWRNAAAIRQAFAPQAPLEQWRLLINERYDLRLSNLSPQAADRRGR